MQPGHVHTPDAARRLAAHRKAGRAHPDRAIPNRDVLGGLIDPQPAGIAARFHTKRVVVTLYIASLHQNMGRGIDIDSVRARAAAADIVANSNSIDPEIVRITEMNRPEAGALKRQVFQLYVGRPVNLNQPDTLAVVVRGPAQSFAVVLLPQRPVLVPPIFAVAVDTALAENPHVRLFVNI